MFKNGDFLTEMLYITPSLSPLLPSKPCETFDKKRHQKPFHFSFIYPNMKYEGAYKGWGKKIRGNSCNMEVSCKPVRGRDVQSLRSSNYLKEKKVKCIRFTVKLHGLSC